MRDMNFYMGDTFDRGLSSVVTTACNCYNDGTITLSPQESNSWGWCDDSINTLAASITSNPIDELGAKMTKLTVDVNRMKEALGLVGESIEKMSFKNGLWGRLRRNQLKTLKER